MLQGGAAVEMVDLPKEKKPQKFKFIPLCLRSFSLNTFLRSIAEMNVEIGNQTDARHPFHDAHHRRSTGEDG